MWLRPQQHHVIPAKAGIQYRKPVSYPWTPAFAGVTAERSGERGLHARPAIGSSQSACSVNEASRRARTLCSRRRRRGCGRRRRVRRALMALVGAPGLIRKPLLGVDRDQLRTLQAPLKERYKVEPEAAMITLSATGELGEGVACSVQTARAIAEAGLHPLTGGDGTLLCSGDMLLEALAACAGVTLRAVSTSLDIPVEGGRVRAEGREGRREEEEREDGERHVVEVLPGPHVRGEEDAGLVDGVIRDEARSCQAEKPQTPVPQGFAGSSGPGRRAGFLGSKARFYRQNDA